MQICYYPEHMGILIEKVLKLLKISRNTGRFQLLSFSHLACVSVGFGHYGLGFLDNTKTGLVETPVT